MDIVSVNLFVEDALSEAALRRIARESRPDLYVTTIYNQGGYGYIKKRIRGLNKAAKGVPMLVAADLDTAACAPKLIRSWLPDPVHPNLVFRIAVREVESWILADRAGLARLLNIKQDLVPALPEALSDPKAHLIELAKRTPYSRIRKAIVPAPGTTAKIGPGYNELLAEFVETGWDLTDARARSDSLGRAIRAIERFRPTWPED